MQPYVEEFPTKLPMIQPIKYGRSKKNQINENIKYLGLFMAYVVYNCFCRHLSFVCESTLIGISNIFQKWRRSRRR